MTVTKKTIRDFIKAEDFLKGNDMDYLFWLEVLGEMLQKASNELKSDKKTFLSIVSHNGHFIEYANKALKKDKQIILATLKQRLECKARDELYEVERFGEDLTKDSIIEHFNHPLNYIDKELFKDKEVCLLGLRVYENAMFYFMHKSLLADPSFILASIKIPYDGLYNEHCYCMPIEIYDRSHSSIKSNVQIAKELLNMFGEIPINYFHIKLQKNKVFVNKQKEQSREAGFTKSFMNIDNPLFKSKSICLALVKENDLDNMLHEVDMYLDEDVYKEALRVCISENKNAKKYLKDNNQTIKNFIDEIINHPAFLDTLYAAESHFRAEEIKSIVDWHIKS